MQTRKQIIDRLDQPNFANTEFGKMIEAFGNPDCEKWFEGVINSLFYKPNEFVLINNGNEDESPFSLLYPSMYSTARLNIYDTLICELSFCKEDLWLPKNQEFIMGDEEPYPVCDKRLASYCTSTKNWKFPKRNNFIDVNFDYYKFIEVELMEFWIETFNKFKP